MEQLENITFDLEEEGRLVRRELDRVIIQEGPFPLVMFLYEELNPHTSRFSPPKAALIRLRKWRGIYRRHSGITISGREAALRIAQTLQLWFQEQNTRSDADTCHNELCPNERTPEYADEDRAEGSENSLVKRHGLPGGHDSHTR